MAAQSLRGQMLPGGLRVLELLSEWRQMKRAELLDRAKVIVTSDRQATHGKPEDTFARIAALWSAYLGVSVAGYDVAAMMALLKIARIRANAGNEDNWLDLAGYAACGAELSDKMCKCGPNEACVMCAK